MKTYNEMAAAVFRRREEYEQKQQRRRQVGQRVAASLGGLCLIALAGLGVWQNGSLKAAMPSATEDLDRPSTEKTGKGSDKTGAASGTQSTDTEVSNRIVINHIAAIPAGNRIKSNICLLTDDYVAMTKEELTAYYGTRVFPRVPDDLHEWKDSQYGIYKRNGGTGAVYWDGNIIHYASEDTSRSINIELAKGAVSPTDIGDFYDLREKSIINGVEVGIGQNDAGYGFAEFVYQSTGFRIITEGLSQEELIAVISSLIE